MRNQLINFILLLTVFSPIISFSQTKDSAQKSEIIYSISTRPNNVFTPDGDGISDCFGFDTETTGYSKVEIVIYNRWGSKVFESTQITSCWNGKLNNKGENCPEGTYFYTFEYLKDGNLKKWNGTITLLRKQN